MSVLKKIKLDENGLREGVDYVFTADGTIDWRAMIPSKYLYANPQRTTETDISKLEDSQLAISLAGLRHIAKLRRYKSVLFSIHNASEHYASVRCEISWDGNYETEGLVAEYSAVAGASLDNTNEFGQRYLVEIASNRAFCRCVRDFLNINIVSQDELGSKESGPLKTSQITDTKISPHNRLFHALAEKNLTFTWLKQRLVESHDIKSVDELASIYDIPTEKLFNIIERVQRFQPKKKA